MSQRGPPCRPCGPSCTTYSQRQVKERPSFWVRTGALHRTSQKKCPSCRLTRCVDRGSTQQPGQPALVSHSSVLDTTDQRPGHCCVSEATSTLLSDSFRVFESLPTPLRGDSHVMVLSSCFLVCVVCFVDPHSPGL